MREKSKNQKEVFFQKQPKCKIIDFCCSKPQILYLHNNYGVIQNTKVGIMKYISDLLSVPIRSFVDVVLD